MNGYTRSHFPADPYSLRCSAEINNIRGIGGQFNVIRMSTRAVDVFSLVFSFFLFCQINWSMFLIDDTKLVQRSMEKIEHILLTLFMEVRSRF